jgi:predicted nucleic acid-binding protein
LKQFVLDCSIAISWCLKDENNGYADEALMLLQANMDTVEAVVPGIWSLEIANTLLVSERRQRLTATQVQTAIKTFESMAVVVDQFTAGAALYATLALGRDYTLAAYDAAYLELAIRRGLPMATSDTRLAQAARACGVFLEKPIPENLP